MASLVAPVEPGQFDDAPEPHIEQHINRDSGAYIDTYNFNDGEDHDIGEDSNEEDEIDDAYDDNRIEDEDWEVAERGMLFSLVPAEMKLS